MDIVLIVDFETSEKYKIGKRTQDCKMVPELWHKNRLK